MKQGLFLSLDGIDGSGKSTQLSLLVEWLRGKGHDVVGCIDPGGTPLGQELRQILLHGKHSLSSATEALLFMASRAQLVAEVIQPALDAGKIVVSDRFLLSNIVYQGHAGGLNVELMWQAGKLSTGGLEPHLTLLLDLPVEEALARRSRPSDRMEAKPLDYHHRVREGFLREATRRANVIVIDALPSVEEVQLVLRSHVEPRLPAKGRSWVGSAFAGTS